MLVPKLVTTLQGYSRSQLRADVTAGVIVGIVAVPLGIAFAIASGVSPEKGLWTAIIAGALISLLGGSRVQIGGPTGAFIVIVYGIVAKHGLGGLTIATMMAGVLLVILGAARLGSAVKFIPHPVVTGFTSGIAVIIFSSQVKDFLGLRLASVPPDFLHKWEAYALAWSSASAPAIGVSVLALLIVVGWPRVSRSIPSPFVALVAATALVWMLDLPVDTIGSRFGAISAAFPVPAFPEVTPGLVRDLAGPAFTIALLASVESLLSAVVADGMIGGRHRPNMELIGQGIANIVAPIFGGIPATGAIARTATNVKNGGRTPVAGVVHALTVLGITLFAGSLAARVPMGALAAILMVVSYNMSEWRTFLSELRSPRSDVAVLLTTFFLTVLVDLTVAISVGMVLASFLFMRRMSEVTQVVPGAGVSGDPVREAIGRGDAPVPPGVEVFEITGAFFFGAAEKFREAVGQVARRPQVLIIRMRGVAALDSTGIHALREIVRRSRREGTRVILTEVQPQPLAALTRSDAMREVGAANVFATFAGALDDVSREETP